MQFSSIWPIDRTLLGANALGQSEPRSDGNKGVLCITQSSSITGASLSWYLLGESYFSAEKQSVYSKTPANWATCQSDFLIVSDFIQFVIGPSSHTPGICAG